MSSKVGLFACKLRQRNALLFKLNGVRRWRCVFFSTAREAEGKDLHQEKLKKKKLRKEAHRQMKINNTQHKEIKNKDIILYELPTKPGEKKDTSNALPDRYSPQYIEAAWYKWWEAQGYFKPKQGTSSDNKKFVVCLPPPNVTGQLHLGHAMGNSIQDAIVRWHRMSGYQTLWNPGTDHAGIATQVKVEKQLLCEEGKTRHEIGRDAFVEKVWQWKNEKGSTITNQMRSLGSSLDWSRDVFTLDPKMCRAVNEAFIRLFDEGLIHRNNRMVNWCCSLQSVISDQEVDHMELEGRTRLTVPGYDKKVTFGLLTDVAFPVVGKNTEVVVSTTRPETVLGDTAIAVHPDDNRYADLHGLHVQHPLCDRTIPIVCDETVKADFGTGAMKITPAHDTNDNIVGVRHGLPLIDILTDGGCLVNVPDRFQGMKRFAARYAVVKALKEKGLYRGEREHRTTIPICSRSGDVIEPRIKEQWFIDCKDMAQNALKAVDDGRLNFIPHDSYAKKWRQWLEDEQGHQWCVSRQLWWGHRVPAYHVIHKATNQSAGWVAAHDETRAIKKACDWLKCSANDIDVIQDPDVLDTWFSSALFPFAIFGWPDNTQDLAEFYPTQLLETASDIMYFWVARMVMLGEKLTGQLPFNKVLFHGILQDRHGRKMSKSLGNVIDPMHIIHGISLDDLQNSLQKENISADELKKANEGQRKDFPFGIPESGTDALRYTMCQYRFKFQFVNVSIDQLNKNRNLCSKIYQTYRYMDSVFDEGGVKPYTLEQFNILDNESQLTATDRWMLSWISKLVEMSDKAFESYDLHHATDAIYSYWKNMSSVYLEYFKLVQKQGNTEQIELVKQIMHLAADTGLRAMCPFMPFLAEELYQRLPENAERPKAESVTIAPYPKPEEYPSYNEEIFSDVALVRSYVDLITDLKNRLNIKRAREDQSQTLYLNIVECGMHDVLEAHVTALTAMCGVTDVRFEWEESEVCGCASARSQHGDTLYLSIDNGILDVEATLQRLAKTLTELTQRQVKLQDKLKSRKDNDPQRLIEREKLSMIKHEISQNEHFIQMLEEVSEQRKNESLSTS